MNKQIKKHTVDSLLFFEVYSFSLERKVVYIRISPLKAPVNFQPGDAHFTWHVVYHSCALQLARKSKMAILNLKCSSRHIWKKWYSNSHQPQFMNFNESSGMKTFLPLARRNPDWMQAQQTGFGGLDNRWALTELQNLGIGGVCWPFCQMCWTYSYSL